MAISSTEQESDAVKDLQELERIAAKDAALRILFSLFLKDKDQEDGWDVQHSSSYGLGSLYGMLNPKRHPEYDAEELFATAEERINKCIDQGLSTAGEEVKRLLQKVFLIRGKLDSRAEEALLNVDYIIEKLQVASGPLKKGLLDEFKADHRNWDCVAVHSVNIELPEHEREEVFKKLRHIMISSNCVTYITSNDQDDCDDQNKIEKMFRKIKERLQSGEARELRTENTSLTWQRNIFAALALALGAGLAITRVDRDGTPHEVPAPTQTSAAVVEPVEPIEEVTEAKVQTSREKAVDACKGLKGTQMSLRNLLEEKGCALTFVNDGSVRSKTRHVNCDNFSLVVSESSRRSDSVKVETCTPR
jgi:hypothetical protein